MKGRIALVTGASRGIGAAIAAEFSARGATVLAPARSQLDLLSESSIQAFRNSLKIPIDILVNNAGTNVLGSMEELNEEQWRETVQINLTAPLHLIQAFAPTMKERHWGRILNISSILSLVAKERRMAYSATKAGLNGLTRTVAIELAPFSVLVNVLCPGYVETGLTRANNSNVDLEQICRTIPMQRLAQPDEIARVAAFLCSDDNTYLTGQTIVADGGFIIR